VAEFNVEESQERWRQAWGESPPIGDVGTRVTFENELVRAWYLELAPGESSPLHTHMHPYFALVVDQALIRARFADGTETLDDTPDAGLMWFGLDGDKRTHVVTNVDTRVARGVVIELLQA
jgi:hypothetical protein